MNGSELVDFLKQSTFWVVSSVGEAGQPQSAVVGVAVSDELELVFDTLDTTNKCKNLRRDGRVSLVMWSGAATAQVEGIADEPHGEALTHLKKVYFATFTDGPTRESWPGITYFRVKPTWIRHSDFAGASPKVVELRPPFA